MGQQSDMLFALLDDETRRGELKEQVERGGYDAFRALVDHWEQRLKEADEQDFEALEEKLAWCRTAFPYPARFSPAWQVIWDELGAKLRWKRHAFASVPRNERDGEWQIIMDNPYTNQGIVCYPGLSFLEAAYLFGYFKSTLAANEYLRMQKIVTVLEVTGETETGDK